jgi:RNA polymerase sigma-70 factor (ECF subfamily)
VIPTSDVGDCYYRCIAPARANLGPALTGLVLSHPSGSRVTEPTPDDDLACLQRVGRGDAHAYRMLVDRYLTAIARFAARILNDTGEAEEVAQETFLRLWTEAASFEPRAQPKTWLYRIARNQCIDRLRKRRTRGTALPLDEGAPDAGSNEDRPSLLFARKQTALRVEQALEGLPERQRAAITLVHYEGLSGAEASEILEISLEALESLLTRGRRGLREQLMELQSFRAGEGS